MASLPKLTAQFRSAARICGVVVSLVGALVLVAWAVNNPTLNRALSGRFIMQLNTGVAFVLAGATLWTRSRLAAAVCAAVITIGGLFILVQHIRAGAIIPGRMEPDTAAGFILVGAALLLRRLGKPTATRVAEWMIVGCLLIAMVGLFGFTYNVKFFFGVSQYARMTLGTALAFVALGLGMLLAEPEIGVMSTIVSDSAGGVMARRLYPAAIAIPIVLGWLTLLGEGMRLYNGKFGLSLFLLMSIVVFLLLVSLTYRALDRTDSQRMRLATVLLEEAERRHLAKELHDEIGQSLTALKLRLSLATASEPVLQARSLVAELTERVSSLSLDLRPAMLDDLGLLPALVWLIERYTSQTGVRVEFAHAGIEGRVAPAVETAAFRIIQEALTNVARHAAVETVNVRAWRTGESLSVQVVDSGRGFDFRRAVGSGKSAGLSGMRERAGALGGALTVESSASGTHLTAELPLSTAAARQARQP
jgi:signal transduction histidine kinase